VIRPHPSPLPAPGAPLGASARPDPTWQRHARFWSLIDPPLRPAAQDVAAYRAAIEEWRATAGTEPTILLLGVTPEICELPLAPGARVIAVDKSADMIAAVWPGPRRAGDAAVRAEWRSLPLADGSVDLVFADGSLCLLPYPAGHAAVCAELRRVLRPGGRWVMRCFVHPVEKESVAAVLEDLRAGLIGGVSVLKWRLNMALQADPAEGVTLARAWKVIHAAWPDLGALAERTGWPLNRVRLLEAYRDNPTIYGYPTLAEHRTLLLRGGFEVMRIFTPDYELGDRCPTLVLAPRDAEGRDR
jgi:SAM-dependent methyltransferase